jgi:seryl-tRNA synthetase
MVIYSRIPTVDIKDAEDTFFKLQEKYRGYQAELNSMKHQIEVALQEDDRAKSQKEIEESKNYQAEVKALIAQISAYRKDAIKAMQSLKIVIPDSLKSVYETVSKMGK